MTGDGIADQSNMASISSGSALWQIDRKWIVHKVDSEPEECRTVDLSRFRCVVLLGAAGSGKTTEARRLAHHERASGKSIRERRLAEYADTSADLIQHLTDLAKEANNKTVFYLDALDEAMMSARQRWLRLKHWITNIPQDTGASVRITCRSAVWPNQLSEAMREFAGEQSFATAYLEPLDNDDIAVAARSFEVDPNGFLAQVEESRAQSLARQPLTLRMLLKLYQEGGGMPSTLNELFAEGLEKLASDPEERVAIGTDLALSSPALLAAAEQLACYTILSGRETVNLADESATGHLVWRDLSGAVGEVTALDRNTLRTVGASGLCDSTSPGSFRFGHRQFAEYLAGRRLGSLPTHQSRVFLASPAGWRAGVAGPLRETAAFAAMFNGELATWLANQDPEVVGLSDVTDGRLRRQAMLGLLDRFRCGDMTDAQVHRGEIELRGFQYNDAEEDLRPILQERQRGCEDVHEYAIALINSWKLSSMSDDLADLALDPAAPLQSRITSSYALLECGTDGARARLKSLLVGVPEDERSQLKGLALRCNWPDGLSVPELLSVLTARRQTSFHGAYEGYLWKLHDEGFAATGHAAIGLRWATACVSDLGDVDVIHRLGMQIARAALLELDDPEVASEMVTLLRHWAKCHQSPLAAPSNNALESPAQGELARKLPLCANREARRQLIDQLAAAALAVEELLQLVYLTPGLRDANDFVWLLGRGCEEHRTMMERQNYLQIARLLPWEHQAENVEAWLKVCDVDPVNTLLGNRKSVELDSEEAKQLREWWWIPNENRRRIEPPQIDPPPSERVLHALIHSETDDIRYFRNVCRELTLEPTSTKYGVERFLTNMPGWHAADVGTQTRIVEIGKAYLSSEAIIAESLRDVSSYSYSVDVLGAMWLILERDPEWLKSRDESWWKDWCRYILYQLSPNMVGEPIDPKRRLLGLLNEAVPSALRSEIVRLSSNDVVECADDQVAGLLNLLIGESDSELDRELRQALQRGEIRKGSVAKVTQFIIRRSPKKTIPVCLGILEDEMGSVGEMPAEQIAVSLLDERAGESWDVVKAFVSSQMERGRRVLKTFAYGEWDRHDESHRFVDMMTAGQLGELVMLLIELFPPENDSNSDGFHTVDADSSARRLRDRMISYLGDLESYDAVEALKEIERRFGTRYPWLRRPRARAERAYTLSQWTPFRVDVVARIIGTANKRLIGSDEDVVDGIAYALERYEEKLRQDTGESAEDLWNTSAGIAPSPKSEEHVASKLCGAVRSYFQDYAISADREVQIHRRSVPRVLGGETGSEVDILVQVPGSGTTSGRRIRIPIEVKLSSNVGAKTAMQDQLVDRYIFQLGATYGVYVVVWMSAPDRDTLQPHHRPRWPSIEVMRDELDEDARRLSEDRGVYVRAVAVDGSLR